MSVLTRTNPLSVPCPTCNAQPDDGCVTATGKPSRVIHATRKADSDRISFAKAGYPVANVPVLPTEPIVRSFVGHPPIGGTERFFQDARRQAFRYGLTERDIATIEARYNGSAPTRQPAASTPTATKRTKSTGDYAPDAKVTVLPAIETRQLYLEGRRRAWADIPQDGMTVAELREAGLPLRHLVRFVSEGWIAVS